jgi:hypothetical protein
VTKWMISLAGKYYTLLVCKSICGQILPGRGSWYRPEPVLTMVTSKNRLNMWLEQIGNVTKTHIEDYPFSCFRTPRHNCNFRKYCGQSVPRLSTYFKNRVI